MLTNLARRTALAIAALVTVAANAPAEQRTWTADNGKFTLQAEFVEIRGDSVILKKADGTTGAVSIARLSDADRKFLAALAKPAAAAPAAAPAATDVPKTLTFAFPDPLTSPPSWADANIPVDMAAFLKAPPPEQNAAPLYLEALAEFSWSEMSSIATPKLPKDGERALSRRTSNLSREYERFQNAWEKDPQTVDFSAVEAWLAEYDIGFKKLALAQQRLTCQFRHGYSLDTLLPHLQTARTVARVALWRTRSDIHRGDLQRPFADLKLLLRLIRDLQPRAPIISQLVASALDGQCCTMVQEILGSPALTVAQCDALLALLGEHQAGAIEAFVESNRAECIFNRQALHDMQHRTGSFDPKTMKDTWSLEGDVNSPLVAVGLIYGLSGFNSQQRAKEEARLKLALQPGAWQGGKLLSDEAYAKEVDAVNRFYADLFAAASEPSFRRTGKFDFEAAQAPVVATVLASMLIPAERAVFEAMRRRETAVRGTQCLIALKRWQLAHAEPASDIDALVKAARMPSAPIDPYSDQPMRLATVAGKQVIYSVGPDGKDDQAQIEWTLIPRDPGDYIFRLDDAHKTKQ